MSPLKNRWKAFGTIIFDPMVISLLICTIGLSAVLILQTDLVIIAIFTFLVSLFSSVLGGIIAKRWDDLTEEKVIVARAKSAHRSLELLLSSVITLERRVRQYSERHTSLKYKEQITPEVIKTYLEEIVEDCVGLEEKVINSMEDWKDILPNLEVKTVLNLIRELNGNYDIAQTQLADVNASLKETKDKSEEEVNKLVKEKKELSKELSRIQKELREKSILVGVPTISGSLISGSTDFVNSLSLGHTLTDGLKLTLGEGSPTYLQSTTPTKVTFLGQPDNKTVTQNEQLPKAKE